MSWDSVSDFEINKAVAKLQGLNNIQPYDVQGLVSYEDVDYDTLKYYMETVDYCNSWADMGPVISEHRIMLNPYCANEDWKAEIPVGKNGIATTYARCYDTNPLRAAAIVYLMMNGVRWEDLV